MFARDADGKPLCWDREAGALAAADAVGISPRIVGDVALADGRTAVPVFQSLAERYLDPQYSPEAVAERCGFRQEGLLRHVMRRPDGRLTNSVLYGRLAEEG